MFFTDWHYFIRMKIIKRFQHKRCFKLYHENRKFDRRVEESLENSILRHLMYSSNPDSISRSKET
jgi:hypothetical protein